MSDPTVEQLHRRIREIRAETETIQQELSTGTAAEKGAAYEALCRINIPLNEARLVMAQEHLNLIEAVQKRTAPEPVGASAVVQ